MYSIVEKPTGKIRQQLEQLPLPFLSATFLVRGLETAARFVPMTEGCSTLSSSGSQGHKGQICTFVSFPFPGIFHNLLGHTPQDLAVFYLVPGKDLCPYL